MAESPLSINEKNHYTNQWCCSIGVKSKDLGCGVKKDKDGKVKDNQLAHPQIDDVVLLTNWKKEFWDCPKFWKPTINNIWSYVYKHKMPLKDSHLRQLTKITKGIIKWRKTRDEQAYKVRTLRKTTSS
jgi:hypothetical protein